MGPESSHFQHLQVPFRRFCRRFRRAAGQRSLGRPLRRQRASEAKLLSGDVDTQRCGENHVQHLLGLHAGCCVFPCSCRVLHCHGLVTGMGAVCVVCACVSQVEVQGDHGRQRHPALRLDTRNQSQCGVQRGVCAVFAGAGGGQAHAVGVP